MTVVRLELKNFTVFDSAGDEFVVHVAALHMHTRGVRQDTCLLENLGSSSRKFETSAAKLWTTSGPHRRAALDPLRVGERHHGGDALDARCGAELDPRRVGAGARVGVVVHLHRDQAAGLTSKPVPSGRAPESPPGTHAPSHGA